MNDQSKLFDQIEAEFAKIVKAVQREVLTIAITGAVGYALDAANKSKLTVQNIAQTNRTAARIRRHGNGKRRSLLNFLLTALLKIFDRNKKFYGGQGSTQSVDDAARKRLLLLYGYNPDTKEVTPGGYLDQVLNFGGIAQQVGQVLNRSLASRQTLPQMQKNLRNVLGRGGRQGLVEGHFRRFTGDVFAEFDRTVKLEYKERLGLRHAVYAGTEIATTRDFCDHRINNIYTEAEVLKWNNQNWKGKKPGDVRIVCGGYNCRHALNWISAEMAETLAEARGGVNNYN